MQEVIQPDENIQPRNNGVSSGHALQLPHAEQETGSTTAESQQHLNVDSSEYEGKDQNKKMSVLGKVKEKAKKFKSKVKKGLKIGHSGEKEIPSDEVSSVDSEGGDGERVVVQDQGIKDEGSNMEEESMQQIIEKNPQFKEGETSDEGGAPSIAELVEDGKKPITPFKSEGPVDALQAVPTQYRDYYNNPTSDIDQMHSGDMKQEEQNHQASAGESFLGVVDGSQHLQGPTCDPKSGSQEEGSRQEIESDKLSDNKSAELGKRAACDKDGIQEEGSRQEVESDKRSDRELADLGKTDAASDKDGIQEEGSRQEVESDKLSDRKSAELDKRDAASDRDGIHEGGNSIERLSSDLDLEGNEGAYLDGKTCKDQELKELPASADLDPQVSKRSVPTEDSSKDAGNLEGNILPRYEAAPSKEEKQKPTLVSEARCEDGTDEERKAAASGDLEEKVLPKYEAASSREEDNRSGRKLSGSNSEMKTSSDNKHLDPPFEEKTNEAGEAFGIGQVSQSGYEADADSNPPSEEEGRIAVHSLQPTPSQRPQPYDSSTSLEIPDKTSSTPSEQTNESIPLSRHAFNGLTSVKDRLVDATSTAAEAVGSSVGYYSLPDSRDGHSLESNEESSQEPTKLENNAEGSLGGKRESGSRSVQEQDPAISESADGSEGGEVRTWSEWLSQTITPAKQKLSSTPSAGELNQDGIKKDMDTKPKVETENPLKSGVSNRHKESAAAAAADDDDDDGNRIEEPSISADSETLPPVLAFPPVDTGGKASTGSSAQKDSSTQEP